MPPADQLREQLGRCRLYAFVDTAYLRGRAPADIAQALVLGGADVIQLRAKQESREQVAAMARAILPISRAAGVPLIINDYPELVIETGSDGVHLGQEDLAARPMPSVREFLGPDRIVGVSTHSLEQALAARARGADYIGVGPIFPTATKPGRPAVGLALVRRVAAARLGIPFVCIGGITLAEVPTVRAAGGRCIAVVSAILGESDVAAAARRFKAAMTGDSPQ